jgi:hypothetical protein
LRQTSLAAEHLGVLVHLFRDLPHEQVERTRGLAELHERRLDPRIEVLLDVRDELVAQAVARQRHVLVRGVGPELHRPVLEERLDLEPLDLEERPHRVQVVLLREAPDGGHPLESAQAGPPDDPMEDRLRLVVEIVPDRDLLRAHGDGRLAQPGVAGLAGRFFQQAPRPFSVP